MRLLRRKPETEQAQEDHALQDGVREKQDEAVRRLRALGAEVDIIAIRQRIHTGE